MRKKQLGINLIASLFAFSVNICISFLLTPYIVGKLGNEAYGFIGLANNFVGYASIMTAALNAMAARFITIELHKDNNEEANIYFNSVLIGNIIMSVVLAIVSLIVVLNLKYILNVSDNLIIDVQLTFLIVFLNFVITILVSIFSISTFVTNRLDLQSIRNIGSNIIRVILTLLLFAFLPAKIYFISIAALVSTIFIGITNASLTKKLLPEIRLSIKCFKLKAVKILLSAGVWNSMGSLSDMLLTGLDLLIANLFINGQAMGILSIAKTVPLAIQGLVVLVAGIFTPSFTILYAKNKIMQLVSETKIAMKFQALIMTVPIVGFIVFGKSFYTIWLLGKTQHEIAQISILSFLTVLPWLLNSYVECLYSHNMITNKIKTSVVVTMILGIVSTVIVLILIKLTNLGIYAIAGVSSIIIVLRILIFVPIYAAHVLSLNWKTYYPPLLKGILAFFVTYIFFYSISINIKINNWTELGLVAIICGVLGYILNFFIVLNKSDIKRVCRMVLKQTNKKKIQ
ncbi:oligosaccharide flippase family protein [Clostridium psychrophilum]|uniref:oligosaccharide flippase family protein n=1 Tax=Clostridium psychrophilum TaxID=132926 RepID=UPI001C0E0A86|nr:oligosaccharide flippase family protein [Clostridium psychrophilum]MBU3180688.1 oligosaccharide flippase family protein [Clostridium psychrophilum]